MKYHDWHLSGYSVLDGGTRIILHLLWDYPEQEMRENHIQFSGVAAYRFTHTDGAIITEIDEEPIGEYLQMQKEFILRAAKQTGLRYWSGDLDGYQLRLEKEGCKYWNLESAIGFDGFVVARTAEELLPPQESVK